MAKKCAFCALQHLADANGDGVSDAGAEEGGGGGRLATSAPTVPELMEDTAETSY
jgi:hypothetical protein